MKLIAYATVLVFMSGCYRWAPVSSLSSIQNDRIEIREAGQSAIINHATAHGQVIEGQANEGGEHVQVDATQTHVFVKRINVPATAAIVTGGVILAAGTFFGALVLAILFSAQPVVDKGGPPP